MRGRLSQQEVYYLQSILRQLSEYAGLLRDCEIGLCIGTEVLADNLNWLDCFIDANTRTSFGPETPSTNVNG